MIIVLKIILFLLTVAACFVGKFVITDFKTVLKTDGYDGITIWQKLKFGGTFFLIITALLSLITFLTYFIIVPMQIVPW
jgi:hypothetical protein